MTPLPHEYDVDLTGSATGYATLSAPGVPDLTMATPPQYDGPGDAWSPEHLLLAAVAACFLFTFRAVAAASKVAFVDVDAHTSGVLARDAGVVRFTSITVHATVTVPPGVDEARVRHAVDKTAGHCLVSASLLTPVRYETTIRTARTGAGLRAIA